MRAYFFCNFYLSSIQQGIQAAHCLAEIFVRCKGQDLFPPYKMLWDWATDHKTMVVLNGGNSDNILTTYVSLVSLCDELDYPYGIFREDFESLNNAITCVGVVVPEKIYKYNEYEQEINRPSAGPLHDIFLLNPITLNTAEKELAKIIASAPLAR